MIAPSLNSSGLCKYFSLYHIFSFGLLILINPCFGSYFSKGLNQNVPIRATRASSYHPEYLFVNAFNTLSFSKSILNGKQKVTQSSHHSPHTLFAVYPDSDLLNTLPILAQDISPGSHPIIASLLTAVESVKTEVETHPGNAKSMYHLAGDVVAGLLGGFQNYVSSD